MNSRNVLLLCLYVENHLPLLFYIIYATTTKCSLTPITLLLAFARRHFVLIETFQVKFCLTETNHLKPIL